MKIKCWNVVVVWLILASIALGLGGCGQAPSDAEVRVKCEEARGALIENKHLVMPDWYRARLILECKPGDWQVGYKIEPAVDSPPMRYALILLAILYLPFGLYSLGQSDGSFGMFLFGFPIFLVILVGMLSGIYIIGVSFIWPAPYELPRHFAITLGVATVIVGPFVVLSGAIAVPVLAFVFEAIGVLFQWIGDAIMRRQLSQSTAKQKLAISFDHLEAEIQKDIAFLRETVASLGELKDIHQRQALDDMNIALDRLEVARLKHPRYMKLKREDVRYIGSELKRLKLKNSLTAKKVRRIG